MLQCFANQACEPSSFPSLPFLEIHAIKRSTHTDDCLTGDAACLVVLHLPVGMIDELGSRGVGE
jgi:hypothetical protein